MAEGVQSKSNGRNISLPMPLISVYVVLLTQFLGVVFMSGVLWTKLEYQTQALTKIEKRIETIQATAGEDRYRGSQADRDFTKVYNTIGEVLSEIKHNKETIEKLQFRVRHFQAQFPDKNILP